MNTSSCDLQYDDNIFIAESVCSCSVSSSVDFLGLSVILFWYPMCSDCDVCTLFMLHVCMLRECEGARVAAIQGMWVVHVVQVLCP